MRVLPPNKSQQLKTCQDKNTEVNKVELNFYSFHEMEFSELNSLIMTILLSCRTTLLTPTS